jgi:hypothetical protein
MKIPQNFEIFPIICVGCIHEIMNQRCTLNKDLGDYLFWNIHEIYYEYFIYRLKKTSKNPFDSNICCVILLCSDMC